MNLQKVLNQIRKFSASEKDKGNRFEKLIKNYFLTESQYQTHIKHIWTWSEFGNQFDVDRTDLGTDIVVETHGDDFWGIQCKFYDEKTSISLKMLGTFLSDYTRSHRLNDGRVIHFTSKFLVTTTNKLGRNVLKYTKDPVNPLITLTLSDLKRAHVDWNQLSEGIFGKRASQVEAFDLRPHQKEAYHRAIEHFKNHSRGKMIMACGTGKTFTSLKISEKLVSSKGVMVYCVPSIALISQTLKEYLDHTTRKIYPICVCSDVQSGRRIQYDEIKDEFVDLSSPATTNPEKLIQQIQVGLESSVHDMVVIFSTYQSIDVLIDAQSQFEFGIQLIICDEAHRTASVNRHDLGDTNFVKVHRNELIQSQKRLYMTATPKIYHKKAKSRAKDIGVDVFSMDDETQFGKEFYRIKFGEAIKRDLLTDYKVITIEVRDDEISQLFNQQLINHNTNMGDGEGKVSISLEDAVKMVGLISVLGGQVKQKIKDASQQDLESVDIGILKRNLLFTYKIDRSKRLTNSLEFITENPTNLKKIFTEDYQPIHLQSEHIDGSMNAGQRSDLLDWLREFSDNKTSSDPLCRILSNVRCMSEGVDVPTLDSAIFWDSKQSEVDIVQSVGRIMRKAEGKKMGYIIVPIYIDSTADQKKEIEGKYKVVWKILRAMRSHDERLDVWINSLQYRDPKNKRLRGPVIPVSLNAEVVVDPKQLDFINHEKQGFIYGKIVQNVGDREYWDEWVKDIAEIVTKERDGIEQTIQDDSVKKKEFEKFVQSLQENINPSIDDQETMSMVSQHIVVKPIFEALFKDYDFVTNNLVSFELELLLENLRVGESLKHHEELQKFYQRIIDKTKGLETPFQKQGLIKDLYNKFFQKIDSNLSAKLGIVYTPIEIVDFMIHSVDDLLYKEFGKRLTDEKVKVIDPFTGTGSYVVRLLQSGLIQPKDLERKYAEEIQAREINLLAYYTADVNIESTYFDMTGIQKDYDNILFTDTFQVEEPDVVKGKARQEGGLSGLLSDNYEKIQSHRNNPVEVIIGNPPYSKSKRTDYKILNKKIKETYGQFGKSWGFTSNSYVKAFRWATDKLKRGGVIALVTPSSWLTENGARGIRHHFEKEFHAVYVYNLLGGYSGAHNVFGIPHDVAITFLIKKPKRQEKANIYYAAIDENTKKKEKLAIIKNTQSVNHLKFKKIIPNPFDDWLNQRLEFPEHYIPLYAKKGGVITEEGYFFRTYSNGLLSGSDAYHTNFSLTELKKQMATLTNDLTEVNLRLISYSPFTLVNAYYGILSRRISSTAQYFPDRYFKNKIISLPPENNPTFGVWVVGFIPSLYLFNDGADNYLPLRFVESENNFKLPLLEDSSCKNVQLAISDWIFKKAYKEVSSNITKEDLFHYVYGFLHSPTYRKKYANTLTKQAPNIPLVKEDSFWQYVTIGKELMDMHLDYENQPKLSEVEVLGEEHGNFEVRKIKFANEDKSSIEFNDYITIARIPLKAHDYLITDKSAIWWVMNQYQATIGTGKTAKNRSSSAHYKKDIPNDPNIYAQEIGKPRYILDLLLSVITLSVKTLELIEQLPKDIE